MADAASGLGRPHILEAAKMPVQDGDETYAIAVTATSERPNCIALCIQTKLEELYASGIVDRSANHRPRLFVVAANDRPDEDVQGLSTALDMLRVAYPDFHIELSERTPEQAMRAALAEDLRDALDACKINASQENFQRLAATMIAAPLFFPAQRPEGEAAPADGQQHLQFGKVRTDDGRTFFCAFTARARLLQWRNMGSVELGVKDYAPLVRSSNDTGIIIDPGVGSGLALTRELLQTLKAQLEFFDQMRNTAAEMGVDFDADAVAEAARNITAADEPEGRNRKERRWFGKKKKLTATSGEGVGYEKNEDRLHHRPRLRQRGDAARHDARGHERRAPELFPRHARRAPGAHRPDQEAARGARPAHRHHARHEGPGVPHRHV